MKNKKPKKPKPRIPVAKPSVRHKSKKDYKRKKYRVTGDIVDTPEVECEARNPKEAEDKFYEEAGYHDFIFGELHIEEIDE